MLKIIQAIQALSGLGRAFGPLPDWAYISLAIGLVYGFVEWRTWVLCRPYGVALYFGVGWFEFLLLALCILTSDRLWQEPGAAVATGFVRFVPTLVFWKLCLFYVLLRWEPVRGIFRLAPWPRAPQMRGPRRKRHREFPEPMPWVRGPFTY